MFDFLKKKPKHSPVATYAYQEPGLCQVTCEGQSTALVVLYAPTESSPYDKDYLDRLEWALQYCSKAISCRLKRKVSFEAPGLLQPWLQSSGSHGPVMKAFSRSRSVDNLVAGQLGQAENYLCLAVKAGEDAAGVLAELCAVGCRPVAPEDQRRVLQESQGVEGLGAVMLQLTGDAYGLANVLNELQSFQNLTVLSYIELGDAESRATTFIQVLEDRSGATAEKLTNILHENGIYAVYQRDVVPKIELHRSSGSKRKKPKDVSSYAVPLADVHAILNWPREKATVGHTAWSVPNIDVPGLLLYTPDTQLYAFKLNSANDGLTCLIHPVDLGGLRVAQLVVKELALAELVGHRSVHIIGGRPMGSDYFGMLGVANVQLNEFSDIGVNPFSIQADNEHVFELICALLLPEWSMTSEKEVEALRLSFDDVLGGHYPRSLRGLQQALQVNQWVSDELRETLLLLLAGPYGQIFTRDFSPVFKDQFLQLSWCPMMQKAIPGIGDYLLKMLMLLSDGATRGRPPMMVLQNPQQWLQDEASGLATIRRTRRYGINCLVVQPEGDQAGVAQGVRRASFTTINVEPHRGEPCIDIYGQSYEPVMGARLVLDNFVSALHE